MIAAAGLYPSENEGTSEPRNVILPDLFVGIRERTLRRLTP